MILFDKQAKNIYDGSLFLQEQGISVTDINVLWQGPAALGEGPVWHPQTGLLYWIDIADPTLHQFNIQNQQHQSWPMPQIIGALAPAQDGHLIAALGKCVVRICMPSGEIEELIRVCLSSR